MIDLTPLDVRKKRGDFRKALRGYDPEEVDAFLEVVAERMEALVTENLTLGERAERLREQVSAQAGREEAVREALVTAQELRKDVSQQARREADLLMREAEARIEEVLGEAERRLEERREALEEMERMRLRFLKSFRTLLERQMDAVEVEEGRAPLDDTPLEIDFTVGDVKAARETERRPKGTAMEGEARAGHVETAGTGEGETAGSASGETPVEPSGPPDASASEALGASGAGIEEAEAAGGDSASAGAAESEIAAWRREIDEELAARTAEEEPAEPDPGSLWLSSILKEERDQAEPGEGEDEWP